MSVKLLRVCSRPDYTAGVILVDDKPVCVSLERPWLENQRRVSCIPAGEYEMNLKHVSPKNGACFSIEDVPDRDHIQMHSANRIKDIIGCVAPGLQYGELMGEFAVLRSRLAMNAIRDCFPGHQEWTKIHIIDAFRGGAR